MDWCVVELRPDGTIKLEFADSDTESVHGNKVGFWLDGRFLITIYLHSPYELLKPRRFILSSDRKKGVVYVDTYKIVDGTEPGFMVTPAFILSAYDNG